MKRSVLLAALLCAGALAGCGKQEGSADSLAGLVKDPVALGKLKDWCNANAEQILQTNDKAGLDKCNLADTATWFVKNPDMLALVKKPEPWPGKSQDFFQASMNASIPGAWIAKSKIVPSSLSPSERKAWDEESRWCVAQLAWKTGAARALPPPSSDYQQISPACVAVAQAQAPGAF